MDGVVTSECVDLSKDCHKTDSTLINGKLKHKSIDNGIVSNCIDLVKEAKQQTQCASDTDDHELCSCGSGNDTTDTTLTESSQRGDNLDGPSQTSDIESSICDTMCRLGVSDSANEINDVRDGIHYIVYESELQMPDIMRLITKDLSEPYSIYTYRYFIHNWPKLCFLAMDGDKCVGAIVCKLDMHKKMVRRGYIAMLAVDSEYRRKKIGSLLVRKAIKAMISDDCDEVVLETEITNKAALRLYENLGFVRDKRLFRYYLNGVDALRLKLWLR